MPLHDSFTPLVLEHHAPSLCPVLLPVLSFKLCPLFICRRLINALLIYSSNFETMSLRQEYLIESLYEATSCDMSNLDYDLRFMYHVDHM